MKEKGKEAMADIGRMKTYNKAEYYAGQHRRMYVYGSAALQPEAVPKQIQKPKKQSVKASRQVRKNRKRAQSISPVYAVFLTGAAIFAVCGLCRARTPNAVPSYSGGKSR